MIGRCASLLLSVVWLEDVGSVMCMVGDWCLDDRSSRFSLRCFPNLYGKKARNSLVTLFFLSLLPPSLSICNLLSILFIFSKQTYSGHKYSSVEQAILRVGYRTRGFKGPDLEL